MSVLNDLSNANSYAQPFCHGHSGFQVVKSAVLREFPEWA